MMRRDNAGGGVGGGVGVIVTSLTSTTTLDTRPTKVRKAWWYEGGRTFSNMGSSIYIWGHRANSGAHKGHVTSWVGEERGGGGESRYPSAKARGMVQHAGINR